MEYVTVRADARLSRSAAEALVRLRLRRSGRLWLGMYIDAFTAPGASLCIARPAAAVADYAVRIIHKLFTD